MANQTGVSITLRHNPFNLISQVLKAGQFYIDVYNTCTFESPDFLQIHSGYHMYWLQFSDYYVLY